MSVVFRRSAMSAMVGLIGMAIGAAGSRAAPPSVYGFWLTDDADVIIEILPCSANNPCGRIVWMREQGPDIRDVKNPDAKLRSRPICGLDLLGGFQTNGSGWVNGWLYHPDEGKTYKDVSLTVKSAGTALSVSVGGGFFSSSETWKRVDAPSTRCAR